MSKWKYNAIDLYRAVTKPQRALAVRAMKRRKKLPVYVLFYHRISNEVLNDWTITTTKFTRQMQWLQSNFEIVSLEECQRRISCGENDRPTVAITFDDGYRENAEYAIPFLIEHGIPATYFVTTEHTLNQKPFDHDVDRNAPLPVDDVNNLRAYANAGIEIGAHTRTHPDIGAVHSPAQIVDEVITASREMEAVIGRPIRYFAFPFGQRENLNPVVFHLLKECGFLGVCSAYGGWNEIGEDPFHLQRIHGDPVFSRLSNALAFDPRMARVERYNYSISPANLQLVEQLKEAILIAGTEQKEDSILPTLDFVAPLPIQSKATPQ